MIETENLPNEVASALTDLAKDRGVKSSFLTGLG